MKKEYTTDLLIEKDKLMYDLVIKYRPDILASNTNSIKNVWHQIINEAICVNNVDMGDVRRVNAIERLEKEIGTEEMMKGKVLIPSEYVREIEFEGRPYHLFNSTKIY